MTCPATRVAGTESTARFQPTRFECRRTGGVEQIIMDWAAFISISIEAP